MSSRNLGSDAILSREPSVWERFWSSPVKTIAKVLYSLLEPAVPVRANGIRVVCVSDTHNTQPKLPNGDILLHAGDLTQSGSAEELKS
jgi:hypothetical protein